MKIVRFVLVLLFCCVALGQQQAPPALVVAGDVKATGFLLPDGTPITPAGDTSAYKARVVTYVNGCDSCDLVSDLDDDKVIFLNQYSLDWKILSVTCLTDTDIVTINLTRDDNTVRGPVDVLSANLPCTPAGATTAAFVAGESALKPGDKLGFKVVTTGGKAHKVLVSIKATLP